MLKGKTSIGFEYEIDQDVLDDYDLVEAIGELDTNPLAIAKIVDLLLGKEQKEALKELIRKEHGKVSVTVLTSQITEIFQSHGEVKK